MPRKPSSAIRVTSSVGCRCSRSISAAFGRTSSIAKARAVAWTASWSSVKVKFTLLPLELRGAARLGKERGHALALVIGAEQQPEASLLERQGGVEGCGLPLVDEALDLGDR